MSTPQPGIFAQGTPRHRHLELDVREDATDDEVRHALGKVLELFSHPGGVNLVVGIGPALWRRLADPGDVPAELADFDVADLPATQHDLWVWLHGADDGALFDLAHAVAEHLAHVAVLAAETACYVYRDSRDLTGFVDGTENPGLDEAPAVALVPEGRPGAGGSFAMAQRWVHRLAEFRALPDAEQEAVIGRTKLDNRELDPRPPRSHLARVVVEDDDGEELQIFRRSLPYGDVDEHGLYFLAFACEPERVRTMLLRMFGHVADGIRDRLTEFSTPATGANYFVPAVEALPFPIGGD